MSDAAPANRVFAFNTSHALSASVTYIFLNTLRYYHRGGPQQQLRRTATNRQPALLLLFNRQPAISNRSTAA